MSDKTPPQVSDSDIAVVGMSGRFPGATTVQQYWENVRDGVESIRTYTEEELLEAGVPKSVVKRPNYVPVGAPLDDMEMFDAPFFGFSPRDGAIMDPQHRHFLECAWEALEDAGHVPSSFDGSIGVFAGCGMQAYMAYNLLTNPELLGSVGFFLLRHTGNDKDFLTTRASYALNLKGPSVNIQTACSTSLVAVHTACQSLLGFECDMALAGGVTIEVPHRHGYPYKENEILAPDGHCRAFDADSKGTIFGSGIGLVVLRRLADAVEDGDVIHAIVKATAINNDGAAKVGYLAPSVEGHAAVVEEAIQLAGVEPESIGYFEAHGTGTPVGDPIEIAALTQAFRKGTDAEGFCGIGSVKSNIGHLDTAAGVASLIKAIQALKNRQMPPTLGFRNPNPECSFESSPFFVNSELRSWPEGAEPRRAGVSSLGVGGTNAHAILEEAPTQAPSEPADPWQLLVFSGKTSRAADANVARMATYLQGGTDPNLADVAHTLQTGREPFLHRRVMACKDLHDAARALEERNPQRLISATADLDDPSVVFMFAGGGAQYPDMGLELYDQEPVYRQSMDRCLEILDPIVGSELRGLLYPRGRDLEQAGEQLQRPLLALPALCATEYALAQLWMSLGIEPAALTGHSMGEYTAACLAGVMSLEDTLALVTERGRLFETLPEGGMLSAPLPEAALQELLSDELSIAAVNTPDYCVLSGRTEAIAAAEEKLQADGVECRRIRINVAAHSAMLEPILGPFGQFVAGMRLNAPTLPMISNVTGTWATEQDVTDPDYWVRHLRQTVRFADGIQTLAKSEARAFLEVGPGSTLASLTRMHPDARSGHAVLSCVRHPQEEVSDKQLLMTSLGRLWAVGKEIDWARVRGERQAQRVSLPTYAFDHEYYWVEPGDLGVGDDDAEAVIEKIEQIDDWYYRPVWNERPLEAAEGEDQTTGGRSLVFLDRAGLGSRLAARLAQLDMDIVTVKQGDAFYALGESEYALAPEEGLAGYQALLEELESKDRLPDRIVHLWTVTPDESARRASNLFHDFQERGFYSLLFLAQALSNLGVESEIDLTVVSNGLQSVAGEPLLYPAKATLLGPSKVIPGEFDNLTCSSVDVSLDDELDSLAADLCAEVMAPTQEAPIAYRAGKRWQEAYERATLEERAQGTRLRDGGVYVITGGLGGIGLTVAEHLATEHKAKLVLIGRSDFPNEADWDGWIATHSANDRTVQRIERVRSLEKLGAEVLIRTGDVANIERMREVLWEARERFGTIHGLIHAAGALEESVIPMKTPESVDRVFTPKVQGTLVLADLLADVDLDFFVLFSSTSTVLGPAGQVDYVAANCFLNAFAASRAHLECQTLALNWGVWQEVGMARELSQRLLGHAEDEPKARELASHPLLDERLLDGRDHVEYASFVNAADRWVLDEHRLRPRRAILPGTGYLELAAGAFREAGLGDSFELRDTSFVLPLEVRDGHEREVRVVLERGDDDWAFEAKSRAGTENSWVSHAEGRVRAAAESATDALDLAEIERRCPRHLEGPDGGALRIDQAEFLEFGPRWQNLRRVSYGEHEALAAIELPEPFAGDVETYALHPALLDVATGFALGLIDGYRPGDALYVPLTYRSIRGFGSLPRHIYSWARSDPANSVDKELASLDVVITDTDGRVLLEIEGFSMRRLDASELKSTHLAELDFQTGARDIGQASPGERLFFEMFEAGIQAEEGMQALSQLLASDTAPHLLVTSIDLQTLIQRSRTTAASSAEPTVKFARPTLESEYEGPRDELESALVSFWEELLGVDQVGINDNFFELGGHSLIAVHLMARIKKSYNVEYPLSVLFEAPTIAQCADLLREEIGDDAGAAQKGSSKPRTKREFLVQLNRVEHSDKPPLFLVSGMLGNVLNLRHLAAHLGEDQPVWAIQARGLYGDAKPHTRFEQMAADYLSEVREVQPEGPYFLGGFSGGGITALEMSQQLRAAGEKIGILIMLDTPAKIPGMTRSDRIKLQWLKLRERGAAYPMEFLKRRWEWEKEKRRNAAALQDESTSPAVFRSAQIEAAFLEALDHYEIASYPDKVTLFRPPLDEAYTLAIDRIVNQEMGFVTHDNHWGRFVTGELDIHVVPGEHNSMVLEPHVRVLAEKLKGCLVEAQRSVEAGAEHEPVPPTGARAQPDVREPLVQSGR